MLTTEKCIPYRKGVVGGRMSEEQVKQTKKRVSLFLVFFGTPVFKLNTCKRKNFCKR